MSDLGRLGTVGTLLVCVAQLAFYQQRLAREPVPPDLIAPVRAAFAALSVDLPSAARIGFLPTITDPLLAGASFSVAQYAVAPHVISLVLDDAQIVVAGPTATQATDDDPRLRGFTFVGERPGGMEGGAIRLYRRLPR